MEILVVGDSHLTGRNPIARLDDLVELQFDKWEYVVQLANDNDVPIVHTGDIFNVAIISNSLLTKLGEILSKLHNPLYFVWGNHDLQYHSMDMWNRTSLGVLWKNNDKVKHIAEWVNDYYKYDWAWFDWGSNDIVHHSTEEPQYLLSHKAVVNTKQTGKNSWILEDENFCLPITEVESTFKFVICGHWHRPYIYHYKGKKVLNPGPLIRRNVDEWFTPSVVMVNLDTFIHKRIYLNTLPPEQVLSRTHIENRIESMTDNVVKFIDSLKNKKVSHKKSFLKTLFHNLDQHELPNKVEKILRDIIANLIEKGEINESL